VVQARKSSGGAGVKPSMKWLLLVVAVAALVWVGIQLWNTFFLGRS
jgi:hypothetical protein